MRILYVNVIKQHAGWGAEWFMDRAFRAIGRETYCVDYRDNQFRLSEAFRGVPACDAFLLQRGEYFPFPILRRIQIPRFFWASELVSRERDQDRLIKSPLIEHVFFRTRGCIETVVSRGWRERQKCSVLLSAFDEEIHRPFPDIEKDIDVAFVGLPTPRRKDLLDRIGARFNLVVAQAYGEEMVRIFNRARIVLNIHAENELDTETRVYEALGCGAFLLSETLSQESPFGSEHLQQSGVIDDMLHKIEYFLGHADERQAIAAAGREAALSGHTYRHRAAQIVEVMERSLKGSGPGRLLSGDWRLSIFGATESLLRMGGPVTRKMVSATRKLRGFLGGLRYGRK